MVVDLNDAVPFFQWLPGAFLSWLLVVGVVAAIAIVVGWLGAALRHGPVAAVRLTGQLLGNTFDDLVHMSPRRVSALAWLAIKESIRRRVVIVFAIFILILMFAGWFLDPSSSNPARLYLSFVLTATSYLVLLLVLFLSTLSLPADIKNHTIYTVVTKPVRASEIVLGRILGFAVIGTCLLVLMGGACFLFVERGVSHTHTLTAEDLQAVAAAPGQLRGHTSLANGHRHEVTVDAAGQSYVAREQGHTHKLTIDENGDGTASYRVGPPEGLLLARVPIYGKLSFRDRRGDPAAKGVNVGDEWTYRSFISGGTLAAAVWTFDGITESKFPNGLPVELVVDVFRTYKGNVEKGIPGCLAVRNPKTGEKVEVQIFESKELIPDLRMIPRELRTAEGQRRDLFADMVDPDTGKLEIWLTCVEPRQYFGVAQADLYLRASDASFFLNFVKGYYGIWLQMLLVIGLGVLFSTFLSGPVALLTTTGALLGGFFNQFMFQLATGKTYGGGPLESMIRMFTQQPVTVDLEPGLRSSVAQVFDRILEFWLRLMSSVLPDFSRFSFADYVAYGFNISGDTALIFACRAFAFLVPVFIAAYLCLKTREVAK